MTKRAKIDLSSDEEAVKKQAPGFGTPEEEVTEKGAKKSGTGAAANKAKSTGSMNTVDQEAVLPSWLDSRTVCKMALVAGAAALTLYLFRRRLF